MKKCVFLFLCLYYLGYLKCNYGIMITDKLPLILDEFKINQPIIRNTLLDGKDLTNIVKNLCLKGHGINFSQNVQNHTNDHNTYQSYLVFTNLINFKWKLTSYAPILVVSRIQNQIKLKDIDVSIGSQVLFLDWFSLKIYEAYSVNNKHITSYLGQFQESTTIKDGLLFKPSKDYIPSIEKRRKNFYGLEIKVAATNFLLGTSDPADFSLDVKFFPNNDTYDVTNMIKTSENRNYFSTILMWMETKFNFTAKLFLRKDMKYGSPTVSPNGTVILGDGVFRDMFEGSVDFICDKMVMLPERTHFGTFLPPIYIKHDAIYIPIMDSNEYLDWTVFFGPLSTKLWIAIILKCIIFSFFVYVVEWFHNYKLVSFDVMLHKFVQDKSKIMF